jgi:hypothetical protein
VVSRTIVHHRSHQSGHFDGADLQDRDGIGLETVIEVPSEVCPGDYWHDIPGDSQGVSVLRAARW